MSSKLEIKLFEYEKSTTISNDEELIKAIEYLIDEESSLSPEKRDYDFIDEAIESLLMLKKVDIEQLNSHSEKIASKCYDTINQSDDAKAPTHTLAKRKKSIMHNKKLIIPLVALITLLAICVTSYAMGYDLLGMTKKSFNKLKEIGIFKQGNYEVIISSDSESNLKLDDLNEKFNFSLLLPYILPSEFEITDVTVTDYGEYSNITIFFADGGGTNTQKIIIKTPFDAKFPGLMPETINGLDVYISEYDNIVQGEFACHQ